MNDNQIVSLYHARDEAAIHESSAKYGHLLNCIAYSILSNREDSEECVSDTYQKAWDSIPPQAPTRLAAYLGRITRNLSINRWHAARAQKRGNGELIAELTDCIPSPQTVETAMDALELTSILTGWLRALPPRERALFLRRYWFGERLGDLADECLLSPNQLAGQMHRLRAKLRTHLEQEGVSL